MSKSPPVKTPVATCEITELTAAEKAAAEAPLKPTVEERADPTQHHLKLSLQPFGNLL